MPENIISQWLNLSSVKFITAVNKDKRTDIYLSRDKSHGFTCPNCGRVFRSAWRWRKTKVRDLSVFEFKPYLVFTKYRINCPQCGIKVEKINFLGFNPHYTKRFEEQVAIAVPNNKYQAGSRATWA